MSSLGLGPVALACALVPAAALAQGDVIDQLVAKADAVMQDKAYKPNGWQQRGELQQGAEVRMNVTLTGGKLYSIVGMCDTDCANSDIVVLDGDGLEVTRDVEADDFPIVNVSKSGTYTVRFLMVTCAANPCGYAVKSYAQ